MVTGIDSWLFRLGDDLPECEPEIKKDGSITCKTCDIAECEYWSEYNEVNDGTRI